MSEIDKILRTEYSEEFDSLRKNRMVTSFYKYGPIKTNCADKLENTIKSLEMRLEKYKQTGNTEFLVDVANFAMMEFMFPQHEKAHFRPTDSSESPGISGTCINELKRL